MDDRIFDIVDYPSMFQGGFGLVSFRECFDRGDQIVGDFKMLTTELDKEVVSTIEKFPETRCAMVIERGMEDYFDPPRKRSIVSSNEEAEALADRVHSFQDLYARLYSWMHDIRRCAENRTHTLTMDTVIGYQKEKELENDLYNMKQDLERAQRELKSLRAIAAVGFML